MSTSSRRDTAVDETTVETPSKTLSALKCIAASALLYSAVVTWSGHGSNVYDATAGARRQLSMVGDSIPSYMDGLMKELRERQKLFEETPPEEVKYWFEYTGPLQVCSIALTWVAIHNANSPSWPMLCVSMVVIDVRNIFTAFPSHVARRTTLREEMTQGSPQVVSHRIFWGHWSIRSFSEPPSLPTMLTNQVICDF